MTGTIWKFAIETADRQIIYMPHGARILCLQVQGSTPCLWAVVNPTAPKTVRAFEVFGTGHPMEGAERIYIGSYQLAGGSLVFHVFEVTAADESGT